MSDLVERLREDVGQLKKMASIATIAGHQTGVRVKDVSALMTGLTEAAASLEAKDEELAALREDCIEFRRVALDRLDKLNKAEARAEAKDKELAAKARMIEDLNNMVLRYLARAETAERRVAELEEVLADKRRLAREIDIALHGEEGTAKQASLCDLVHPARQLRLERDQAKTALKACLPWVIGASEQITDAARAVIKQGEMPWLLSRHAPGDFE